MWNSTITSRESQKRHSNFFAILFLKQTKFSWPTRVSTAAQNVFWRSQLSVRNKGNCAFARMVNNELEERLPEKSLRASQ